MARKKKEGYWCLSYHKSLLRSIEPISVTNRKEYEEIISSAEKLLEEYRNCDFLSKDQTKFLDTISDYWYIDKKKKTVNFGGDSVSFSRRDPRYLEPRERRYCDELKWIKDIKIGQISGTLYVSYNGLEKLESWIPKKVSSFSCTTNKLESLQNGPDEVEGFYDCSKNELIDLDGIASSFKILYCNNNKIKDMSAIPTSVEVIEGKKNLMESFETLPKLDNIKKIDLSYNRLTSMKGAPLGINLRDLNLKNNPVSEKTLKQIYSEMRKKPKKEYEDILNDLWKSFSQYEHLLMYKHNTRLSDKAFRGYDALARYNEISSMI